MYLLQRTEERLTFTEEIGESQTMLRLVQEQAQQNSNEHQKLLDQLQVMQLESGMVLPISTTLVENMPADYNGEPLTSEKHSLFKEPSERFEVRR